MTINWYHFIIFPLTGFVGMFSGGYWGIGCSWLIVPVMLLSGATPMEAAGVALLQMVPSILPTVARDASKLGWGKRSVGRSLIVPIAVMSLLFSVLGSLANGWFYQEFGANVFRCLFMLVMLYLGLKMLFSHTIPYGDEMPRFSGRDSLTALFHGSWAGFLSSFLGIGGGMLFRPVLAMYYKLPESVTANATRFLLLTTSLMGGLSYIFTGKEINWHILLLALLISAGGLIGFPLGVRMHKTVCGNGYAAYVQKSFSLIALVVMLNLVLSALGLISLARILMIAVSIALFVYINIFGSYTKRHPK